MGLELVGPAHLTFVEHGTFVDENGEEVEPTYTVSGVDSTVTWSLDGLDKEAFNLAVDSNQASLSFLEPPNYEAPTDTDEGGTNTYHVTVVATLTDGASEPVEDSFANLFAAFQRLSDEDASAHASLNTRLTSLRGPMFSRPFGVNSRRVTGRGPDFGKILQKEFSPMVIQSTCLVVPLVLCILLAPPTTAQEAGVFEGSPTDFLPLQVGNKWTYKHRYGNYAYEGSWWDQNPEIRMLFEVPGGYRYPPDSLLWVERELTIEITHTEMIDGLEYFVFSRADYDWPPVPNLSWADQKVRLSDEGVLLFRWNGQDVPLYDLNFQHPRRYSIPAYPIREDLVIKLVVWRWNRDESQIEIIFSAIPEINLPNSMHGLADSSIRVLPGYGLAYCGESYHRRSDFFFWEGSSFEIYPFFYNVLNPISAIISGEVVSYEQVPRRRNTHVQSSSWGRLKKGFLPR